MTSAEFPVLGRYLKRLRTRERIRDVMSNERYVIAYDISLLSNVVALRMNLKKSKLLSNTIISLECLAAINGREWRRYI